MKHTYQKLEPRKPSGLSILTLPALVISGAAGYMLGEVIWMRQPHMVHYVLIIQLAILGCLVGEWIYKRRGYRDVM